MTREKPCYYSEQVQKFRSHLRKANYLSTVPRKKLLDINGVVLHEGLVNFMTDARELRMDFVETYLKHEKSQYLRRTCVQ